MFSVNLPPFFFLKTLLAIVGPLNFLKRSRMGLSISTEKPVEVLIEITFNLWGFPGSSAGKESACNAGDSGSISGLGRSPGEGKGYPLQYSGLENSMGLQRVGYNGATFTFFQ